MKEIPAAVQNSPSQGESQMCQLIIQQTSKARVGITWYHLNQTFCVERMQYCKLVTFTPETCSLIFFNKEGDTDSQRQRQYVCSEEQQSSSTVFHMCISLSAWILLSRCWDGFYGKDCEGKIFKKKSNSNIEIKVTRLLKIQQCNFKECSGFLNVITNSRHSSYYCYYLCIFLCIFQVQIHFPLALT